MVTFYLLIMSLIQSDAANKHVEEQATRMARALQAEYWVNTKHTQFICDIYRILNTKNFNSTCSVSRLRAD